MKLKTALFTAAATLALAPAAHAYQGLYGAIGAGLSYMADDRDVESLSGPVTFDSDADYDKGIGVYTSLGYSYNSGWRTELEFSYRNHDARHWVSQPPIFSGFTGGTLDGEVSSYAFMANLLKDFGRGAVSPYVGAGIGLARVKSELTGVNPGAIGGYSPMIVDDADLTMAYQGIAGLAFQLAEGLALDLSYRYFGTLQPEFAGTLGGAPFTYKTDYTSHNVFAGLRWNFGASAPAQVQYKDCWDGSSVPVSAECPPQLVEQAAAVPDPVGVTVYFDYDKANLTPEAAELVREAAARAVANDIETVRVEGHTDRSGSTAYNQALSQRRANVVRDALIANGVPADTIVVDAFGEDRPAKPTPDGVREPLNRRTEVTISFE